MGKRKYLSPFSVPKMQKPALLKLHNYPVLALVILCCCQTKRFFKITQPLLKLYTAFLSGLSRICAFLDFLPTECSKSLQSWLFLLLQTATVPGSSTLTLPLSATSSLWLSSPLKSCCFNYHLCVDESQISQPFCSHSQFRISSWIFATSPNAVCWKAEITFLPKPSLLPASFPISVNNSTTLCPTNSQPGCHFQLLFASHTIPVDFLPTAIQKYLLSFPLLLQLFKPCSFLKSALWHPHSIIIPCPSTLKPELTCIRSNPPCPPPLKTCVRTHGDGRKQNGEPTPLKILRKTKWN